MVTSSVQVLICSDAAALKRISLEEKGWARVCECWSVAVALLSVAVRCCLRGWPVPHSSNAPSSDASVRSELAAGLCREQGQRNRRVSG